MRINKRMSRVIAELEYLIGCECYNPNSYDGWNDIEGCEYRYPICYPTGDNDEYAKTRSSLEYCAVLPENMQYIKYVFGTNELFIGRGIIHVLKYLEKRYGLDFNELENELHRKST